jgi:cytochrome c-type biogenesis protein CcmH
MKSLSRLLVIFSLMLSFGAFANEAELIGDPVFKKRMDALTKELRCLKCQNQTIYDSPAGLADDLRRQIHTQMKEGRSDDEIVEYLVARYGDFVRYKPRLSPETLLLWVGPFLLMAIGVGTLFYTLRNRRKLIVDKPLSGDDEKRVKALIGEGEDK